MTNFEKWKRDLTMGEIPTSPVKNQAHENEPLSGSKKFRVRRGTPEFRPVEEGVQGPALSPPAKQESCTGSNPDGWNYVYKSHNEKEETSEMKAARIFMLRADAEFAGILQTERLVETFLRIRIGETHDAVAALREEIQKLKDNVDAKKKNALTEYCRLNGIDTSKWEESDEKNS